MKIPVSKAYAKWMDEDAERLNAMAELARKVAVKLPKVGGEERAFCPTGEGGGVKNDCGGGSTGTVTADHAKENFERYVPFKSIGDSKNSDYIRIPSNEEISSALNDANVQQSKIGANRDLPDQAPVALRIDIPAWKNSGGKTYVVTVHEGKNPDAKKPFGKVLGYDSMARLSGPVRFTANDEDRAQEIAEGKGKTPLATVNGKFNPSREIPADIDSWTPVGYDPQKAVYFYDKRTGREITGGTDAVSVGNTVFTRNPVYGRRNARTHYRSLAEMYATGSWGIESRAFCPTGEGGGVKNDCPPGGSETATTTSAPKSTPASTKMPRGNVGDRENSTSWLSPDGTFYPVPRVKPPALRLKSPYGFTTHDEWASLHGHEGGEDDLLAAGWARVTKGVSDNHLYANTHGRPLSSRQKKSLEDQAMIVGNDSVIHDPGGLSSGRTIWSKHDRAWREESEDRAFCPTGEGNGVDNSCSASTGGGKQAERITISDFNSAVSESGHSGLDAFESMEHLDGSRQFEFVGSISKNIDPLHPAASASYAKQFVTECGYGGSVSVDLERWVYRKAQAAAKDPLSRYEAASAIAVLGSAASQSPEIIGMPIRLKASDQIQQEVLRRTGDPRSAMRAALAAAIYSIDTDEITVNIDSSGTFVSSVGQAAVNGDGPFSTDRISHAITHESGHLIHFRAIRESLGIKSGVKASDDEIQKILDEEDSRVQRCLELIGAQSWEDVRKDSPNSIARKIASVSLYSQSMPSEFVAEYYTGLRLGVLSRDKDLDKVAEELGFPMDKMPEGKRKRGKA